MKIRNQVFILLVITFILLLVLLLDGPTKASETPHKTVVKTQEVVEKVVEPITHTGYPLDSVVQDYVRYAYKISGKDLDFVAMLEAENGRWDHTRQSSVPDNKPGMSANGREDSRGFCQLHRRWHKYIVDDPLFWSDPYWQLDQCYNKYKGGTVFYGYFVRHKVINRFVVNGKTSKTTVNKVSYYLKAKAKQEQANELWKKCKDSGECKE